MTQKCNTKFFTTIIVVILWHRLTKKNSDNRITKIFATNENLHWSEKIPQWHAGYIDPRFEGLKGPKGQLPEVGERKGQILNTPTARMIVILISKR